MIKYLNIDALGNVYEYDTRDAALDAAMRSPTNWKAIAIEKTDGNSMGWEMVFASPPCAHFHKTKGSAE